VTPPRPFESFAVLPAAQPIQGGIHVHRDAVVTGRVLPADLDGKQREYMLRITSLLGLKAGIWEVTSELRELARQVWERSCAVRDAYAARGRDLAAENERLYAPSRPSVNSPSNRLLEPVPGEHPVDREQLIAGLEAAPGCTTCAR
jgi:hypothetical protein